METEAPARSLSQWTHAWPDASASRDQVADSPAAGEGSSAPQPWTTAPGACAAEADPQPEALPEGEQGALLGHSQGFLSKLFSDHKEAIAAAITASLKAAEGNRLGLDTEAPPQPLRKAPRPEASSKGAVQLSATTIGSCEVLQVSEQQLPKVLHELLWRLYEGDVTRTAPSQRGSANFVKVSDISMTALACLCTPALDAWHCLLTHSFIHAHSCQTTSSVPPSVHSHVAVYS